MAARPPEPIGSPEPGPTRGRGDRRARRDGETGTGTGTGTLRRYVGVVVLAALAVIVLAQNTEKTTVEILFWDLEGPRFVVLAAALLVGALLGELGAALWRRRRRRANH